MKELIAAVGKVFADGVTYLEALDEAQFQQPVPALSGSTIGQHTRHWVEFFQCLLDQASRRQRISYDERVRDPRLESSPVFVEQTLRDLSRQVRRAFLGQSVYLDTSLGDRHLILPTSVGRELWYAVEHAIHHLAIIKIGLREIAPDLELPADFGVAYSTSAYRREAKVVSMNA